ncbi:MAG: nucleotidyltransferase family protein [Actinomycetota bacterium]|nr:nucleotidyltransferase family protein [Actinomycetota bacterium]
MKLIVLAAGYATRLYPLTLDRPKALLPVAGRPMVEHVLDRVAAIGEIDGLYLVTNAKFAGHFREWAAGYRPSRALAVTIVDDGTTDDATRLGAIGDLELVVSSEGVDDDIVVVAGDNLFTETLEDFGRFGREKDAPVLAVYDVGTLEAIRRYSAIEIDESGRITSFEEKPAEPRSTLTGIALYFYPRSALPLVRRYLEEGNNPDQPGRLVEWLYRRTPVYTWRVPGLWYDIGSEETLREADRMLGERGR